MQNHQQSDRLSWGDTVFLHLEREGMPLNVASICIFEGEVLFEDCVQFIESKLPLLPRYLKRVVPAPFGLGHHRRRLRAVVRLRLYFDERCRGLARRESASATA